MNNAYMDCYTSLLAHCKNFLGRQNIAGFEVYDFDAHATAEKLPEANLVGITEYSIVNATDLYDVTVMFIVCTRADDTNLINLRDTMNKLFGEMTPGGHLDLYNKDGDVVGKFTIKDDIMVTGVGSTKTRPMQGLAVSLGVAYQPQPSE